MHYKDERRRGGPKYVRSTDDKPALLSVLLCLIAGAAIDTGTICIVRAVNEAIDGRPALVLGTLVALLCAALVFTLDTAMDWQSRTPPWAWPTLRILFGAIVFGAGAALNGACSTDTITRLCRGDTGYAATLAGALAVALLVPRTLLPTPAPDGVSTSGLGWFAVIALLTCTATIWMGGVLPHPGMLPSGSGIASPECSRRCVTLSTRNARDPAHAGAPCLGIFVIWRAAQRITA